MKTLISIVLFWGLQTVAFGAPNVGKWGEDPRVVPDFAASEERRAPKMPGADKVFGALSPTRTFSSPQERALLVCKLQVGQPKSTMTRALLGSMSLGLSELTNASAALRLTVGNTPTIVLWAPRMHDTSYVSIPALDLAIGDRLTLAVSDRVLAKDRALGAATTSWNGLGAIDFTTSAWSATCRVTDHDDALERSKSWLASVDRQLDAYAAAKPSRDAESFGRPTKIEEQLESAYRDLETREGNFRYAAGFLGWDAPEIQTRLERLRTCKADFDRAVVDEVRNIVNETTPEPLVIDSITATFATRDAKSFSAKIEGDGLTCKSVQDALSTLMLVDDRGRFYTPAITITDRAHKRCGLSDTRAITAPATAVTSLAFEKNGPLVLVRSKSGFTKPAVTRTR